MGSVLTQTNQSQALAQDKSSEGLRLNSQWIITSSAVTLVAWLTLIPLGFLVYQSVMTPQTANAPQRFTWNNFVTAYSSAETFSLFLTSVQFATGTAIFALTLGTLLAWMNERTNTPFKSLFYALSIIPLVIPGILFVVSWIMLASPKIGLINLVLRGVFDTDFTFVDVYSLPGIMRPLLFC